jgi:hypothetical protein
MEAAFFLLVFDLYACLIGAGEDELGPSKGSCLVIKHYCYHLFSPKT